VSDGCFYPIAPSVYTLELKPLEERNGNTQRYQWKARTHGHSALSIPVEMQEVVAFWTGDEARLTVPGPVTPEFVGAGWPYRTPTVFYPDGSLWTSDRLEEGEFDELPMPISRDTDPMQRAPVVAEFDSIFQQVYIRGVSTPYWRRGGDV
jgi:hypothetical protein